MAGLACFALFAAWVGAAGFARALPLAGISLPGCERVCSGLWAADWLGRWLVVADGGLNPGSAGGLEDRQRSSGMQRVAFQPIPLPNLLGRNSEIIGDRQNRVSFAYLVMHRMLAIAHWRRADR